MAITLQEAVFGGGGSPPPSVAFTTTVAVGDVLTCTLISIGGGDPGTMTVSDTVNTGNWSQIGTTLADATTGWAIAHFWKVANASGTPTVSMSQSNALFGNIAISRFNGFTGTPTVDSALTSEFLVDTASASFNYTPIINGFAKELTLLGFYSPANLNSTPSGWTQHTNNRVYYAVQTSASTANPFTGTLASSQRQDAMVVGIYDASAGGSSISPTVGSLALSGIAPTVTKPTVTKPSVLIGSLALAGIAPTVTKPIVTLPNPSVTALTLTGAAVTQTLTVPAAVTGALLTSGIPPTLAVGVPAVVPAVGSLSLSGVALSIGLGIKPMIGAETTGAAAPALNMGMAALPGTLSLTGQVALLGSPLIPSTGALALSGVGPWWALSNIVGSGTLSFGAVNSALNITINTGGGALSLAGSAPVMAGVTLVTPSAGVLSGSVAAGRLTLGLTTNAGTVALNGQLVSMGQAIRLSPGGVGLALTGVVPAFGIVTIAPDTAAMTLVGQAAPSSSLAIMPLGGKISAVSRAPRAITGYAPVGLYLRPLPAAIPVMKAGVY